MRHPAASSAAICAACLQMRYDRILFSSLFFQEHHPPAHLGSVSTRLLGDVPLTRPQTALDKSARMITLEKTPHRAAEQSEVRRVGEQKIACQRFSFEPKVHHSST